MPNKINLIGKKFGKLTVIEEAESYVLPSGKKATRWLCRCDCGNEKIILTTALLSKTKPTRSCGCLKTEENLSRRHDVIGKRFGRLTIIGEYDIKPKSKNDRPRRVICRCDCGNEIHTTLSRLAGGLRSCGCLLSDTAKQKVKDGVNGSFDGTNVKLINQNRPLSKNNKTGIRGVYFNKTTNKYIAKIGFRNQKIHLGSFKNIEDAAEARKKAEEEYFKPVLNKYNNKD